MQYALGAGGERIRAHPKGRATCPCCGARVEARCGSVRIWHWAHEVQVGCDPWWEGETEWHLAWKNRSDADRVEVPFGEHRADIVGRDGVVIELQHSSLDPEEIARRERFYGKMVWLLDGAPFAENFRVFQEGGKWCFRWAHARPSWIFARKPRFVHGFTVGHSVRAPNPVTGRIEDRWTPLYRSEAIFQVLTVTARGGIRGTGRVIDLDRFCAKLIVPPEAEMEAGP